MAEIRKFDPAAGNAIAQALRQAMGDPVRPNTPGESRTQPKDAASSQQTATFNLTVTTQDGSEPAKPAAAPKD